MKDDPLNQVLRYHEETKHRLNRYARSLGFMDWANQPDPFRRYAGAPLFTLDHPEDQPAGDQPEKGGGPTYDALFEGDGPAPRPWNRSAASELFYYSLALSAWKGIPGGETWPLRVNPSSGNLHPTEGYLIAGPIEGISDTPAVYHYAPSEHALEQRRELDGTAWETISTQLPPGSVLVGLTSIYWREAWKYGERAFRYCNHDVGHAIGAVALSAATLGWESRMAESVPDRDLAVLLGVHGLEGPEKEHPDCLLVLFPGDNNHRAVKGVNLELPPAVVERLSKEEPMGVENRLSPRHHPWPIIDEVSGAARFPGAQGSQGAEEETVKNESAGQGESVEPPTFPDRSVSARSVIRQRRSAVAMDGESRLSREAFYRMLLHLSALDGGRPLRPGFPYRVLPWEPAVSLALFVHRIDDLEPGLYLQVRHRNQEPPLRAAIRNDFLWQKPEGCPEDLGLYQLQAGDCREIAEGVSCQQAIAGDGVFALGMVTRFESELERRGPWFYPRLFWETGLIGQVLYLEAEAAGLRGTGIGCFFDDAMHRILGMKNRAWQSLYHFTVGGPLEDRRLQTLPAYQ